MQCYEKVQFGAGVQGFVTRPHQTGLLVWLDPMFGHSATDGGVISSIKDRKGNTFSLEAGGPIYRASGGLDGNPAIEVDGNDRMVSTANIDFSGTSKVHVFAVAQGTPDTTPRAICEHTATTAPGGGNGFLVYHRSTNPPGPTAQCLGDVGQSTHSHSGKSLSTYRLVEGVFDKTLSTAEAKVYVDTELGDTFLNNSNNTNAFSSDLLYLFDRSSGGIPFNGFLDQLLIYDRILTGSALAQNRLFFKKRWPSLGFTL